MKNILALIAGTIWLGASGASAQPAPAGHEQHQHPATDQAAMQGGCCCGKDMAEIKGMMAEMMKMHHEMMQHGMKMPMDGKTTSPGEPKQ